MTKRETVSIYNSTRSDVKIDLDTKQTTGYKRFSFHMVMVG
jgi:hypothetical protein